MFKKLEFSEAELLKGYNKWEENGMKTFTIHTVEYDFDHDILKATMSNEVGHAELTAKVFVPDGVEIETAGQVLRSYNGINIKQIFIWLGIEFENYEIALQ